MIRGDANKAFDATNWIRNEYPEDAFENNQRSDLFTKEQVIELIKDYFGANAIDEQDLSLYIGAIIEQREFSKIKEHKK